MRLTGYEFLQLQQALLSAFPSPASLAQMVRVRFDLNLAAVAGGNNHTEVMFNLITWAESEGKVEALLQRASQENPGNEELKAFVAHYGEARAATPPMVDLSNWITIHDQGAEGTVAAVAMVTAMEASLAKQGKPMLLSSRYLYEKAKRHDEQGDGEGTYLAAVLYVAERFGVPPEASWPYVPGDRSLPKGATWDKLDSEVHCKAVSFRTVGYDGVPEQLSAGRPILAGINIYRNSWMSLDIESSGQIQMPPPGDLLVGGHAITIVSYLPADASVRFANSWGPTWGDHGFGSMTREVAEAHSTGEMWGVEVAEVAEGG